METLLLVAVILLQLGDEETAYKIVCGLLGCIAVLAIGVALVAGWTHFPIITGCALGAAVILLVVFLCRRGYARYFSAEAQLQAAYQRMGTSWDKLIWHVVRLESFGARLEGARVEGQRLLARCKRAEHGKSGALRDDGTDAVRALMTAFEP